MFKTLLLLCVVMFSGNADVLCPEDEIASAIIKKADIDVSTKSPKGWIRIFSSQEKIKERNIKISEDERIYLVACLNEKYNSNIGRMK